MTAEATSLIGAPAEYLLPATRPTLAEAQAWCRHLATSHYENFHVATWFLPKRARPHFESIYAFSRTADDLGDEVADRETATRLLGDWHTLLDECYDNPAASMHPVFVALHQTIVETGVLKQLFADLISAFEMDQVVTMHQSLDDLIGYSRSSPQTPSDAWSCGSPAITTKPRALLSDKVCTALQLANFWQDVVEDWERGRRYIPADQMVRFGVTDEMIAAKTFTPEFKALMQFLVGYAGKMLREGGQIADEVDAELAVTLRLFEQGAEPRSTASSRRILTC